MSPTLSYQRNAKLKHDMEWRLFTCMLQENILKFYTSQTLKQFEFCYVLVQAQVHLLPVGDQPCLEIAHRYDVQSLQLQVPEDAHLADGTTVDLHRWFDEIKLAIKNSVPRDHLFTKSLGKFVLNCNFRTRPTQRGAVLYLTLSYSPGRRFSFQV